MPTNRFIAVDYRQAAKELGVAHVVADVADILILEAVLDVGGHDVADHGPAPARIFHQASRP